MPESESRAFEIKYKDGGLKIPRGNNYLLIIGIDDYMHVGKLQNAVRDAKAFKKLLIDKYHFSEEYALCLFDNEATYSRIDQGLRSLHKKIKKGDNLLIYFSGHGHYDEFYGDGYWIPVDAQYEDNRGYFSYKDIISALAKIESQHTFMIVDSCYSGAVLVENTRDSNGHDPREKDPSRWILASGRNEVVPDGKVGGHSPFAVQLLDTLDRYADEGISVLSLVDKVTRSTIHNGKQKPIGRPIQNTGDKGGQFIFYPKSMDLGKVSMKSLPETQNPSINSREIHAVKTKKKASFGPLLLSLSLLFAAILGLAFSAFVPKKNLRIKAEIEAEQFSFQQKEGTYNFRGIPLTYCRFTDFEKISLEADKFTFNRSGNVINRKLENELSFESMGEKGISTPIRSSLLFESLQISEGSKLNFSRIDPDKFSSRIKVGIEQDNPEKIVMSYLDSANLELEYIDFSSQEDIGFIDELSSLTIFGPAVSARRQISVWPSNSFSLSFDINDSEDSVQLNTGEIGLSKPHFFKRENSNENVPVSSIISGKIFFLNQDQEIYKSHTLSSGEKLALIGDKEFNLSKMLLSEKGYSLELDAVPERVEIDGANILNPPYINWLWQNHRLLFLISVFIYFFLFLLSLPPLRKKMIGIFK
ncbi:MAG: caspase family protein [Bacteroidia bacterium]|nr:caspase family protein [Bacteroidia bacterium]